MMEYSLYTKIENFINNNINNTFEIKYKKEKIILSIVKNAIYFNFINLRFSCEVLINIGKYTSFHKNSADKIIKATNYKYQINWYNYNYKNNQHNEIYDNIKNIIAEITDTRKSEYIDMPTFSKRIKAEDFHNSQ